MVNSIGSIGVSSTATYSSKAINNIASGSKINSAADNAAGLSISEGLLGQSTGLEVAAKNVQDGASLLQVADGALQSSTDILQRMRELAVQSSNGILSDGDRSMLQSEFSQLNEQLSDIAKNTQFNGKNLLDGSLDNGLTLQSGANAGQNTTVKIGDMGTDALGTTALSIGTFNDAQTSLSQIDEALKTISSTRSTIGATSNALQSNYNNLLNTNENLTSANSRIRDADIAEESVKLAKDKILSQTQLSVQAMKMKSSYNVLNLL